MATDSPRALVLLNRATRMLAEATTLPEMANVRHTAEAARTFAKAAQMSLAVQNQAAEVRLRAERKAGKALAKMSLHGGSRGTKKKRAPVRLEDLGIAQHQSKRWQLVASLPESEFTKYITSKNDLGEELTSSGLMRLARQQGQRVRNGTKRKSARAADQSEKSTTATSAADNVTELFQELNEHRRLLSDILRPVYDKRAAIPHPQLKKGERLAVGHLLQQIQDGLHELEQAFHKHSD